MNRSQLVFVIIVNALFTLLAASVAYLIYDLRRPEPEAPFVLEVASTIVGSKIGTPSVQVPAVTPTVALENADATAAEVINSRIYTIREGDTLGAIAELFGVAQSSLAALNGISDPNLIVPGQSLIIPDVRGSTELGTGSALAVTDMAIQVLNVGQYAEEAIVIVNLHSQLINLSDCLWSQPRTVRTNSPKCPRCYAAKACDCIRAQAMTRLMTNTGAGRLLSGPRYYYFPT